MSDARRLLEPILALHDRIRDSVVEACERQSTEQLAAVAAEESSDTIYRIDRVSEDVLVAGLEDVARDDPLVLVAEGLAAGKARAAGRRARRGLPVARASSIRSTARARSCIRSAARGSSPASRRTCGDATRIRDIELAVQTEIPVLKQHLCDQLWAVRGRRRALRRGSTA